jgi:replicative DNA helicase
MQDLDWLMARTEQFCQERAIYNAIRESVLIMDGKDKKQPRHAIPSLLQEALAVSFDSHIGHDYLDDAESRYESYHRVHWRVPFDLEYFNKITKGGLPPKTLNVIAGGVGFGKTMMLCHFAATNMVMGKKVLYITLEMSEEEISKRIDANLLDTPLDNLMSLSRDDYMKKIAWRRQTTVGKLIIHEYPSGGASSGNFRHLLRELRIKKGFVPDILYVDYLNICASSRISFNGRIGLYEYVKTIAEELRGLGQEHNIPVFSATQLNREGFRSSDPGMDDTAESWGLPATVDFLVVIVQSDELHEHGQVEIKQLKNRYSDYLKDTKFNIMVHRDKMRLADVENYQQSHNVQDGRLQARIRGI